MKQQQFLEVIDRDEAETRWGAVIDRSPRGDEVVPLADALGRVLAEDVRADVDVPAGARVIDLSGRTIIPGLVESHSHMGLKQLYRPETGSDNNELSKPINAEVRAVDNHVSVRASKQWNCAASHATAGAVWSPIIVDGALLLSAVKLPVRAEKAYRPAG